MLDSPYQEAGINEGARASIFESFNSDLEKGISKDLAAANAKHAFLQNGGEEVFKNIVSDVFKDHFSELWDSTISMNMPDNDDDDAVDEVANLIPRAEEYIKAHNNVLLIGPHGTGKTESLMTLCNKMGIKMKYFSCSTLDPYTDLVGVPVPTENADGTKNLVMVRDHDIDNAELIFFDEFNRADSQTMNAVFEIIQFGTINGEKLPKLNACWAAMNPADGDYTVQETDPALLDRFDAYIKMEPTPSVAYMKQYMPVKVAKALVRWWNQHEVKQKNAKLKKDRMVYISPRRLFKLGMTWELFHTEAALLACLPPNAEVDHGKLVDMLEKASGMKDSAGAEGLKALGFPMEKGYIKSNFDVVGETIKADPTAQSQVLECLFKGSGPYVIFTDYSEFVDKYCTAAAVESVINNLTPTKKSNLKAEFEAQGNANAAVKNSFIYRALLTI